MNIQYKFKEPINKNESLNAKIKKQIIKNGKNFKGFLKTKNTNN